MLEIINVSKDYYDFEFELKNISFSLEEGFVMGLIGPNGSGKTTIINLLMNIIFPTEGEIKIFGLDNIPENNVEIKDNIGFVFDQNILPDNFNLSNMEAIHKIVFSNFDQEYFNELVKRLKISKEKKFKDLSKGQNMKAQIALALSHNAKLIIMDEPTAGLDPIVRRETLKILREYRDKTNCSILYSTHITEDLETFADYLTFINNGHLVFSEDIETIRENYKIVKIYSDAAKNFNKDSFLGYEEDESYFIGLVSKENLPEGVPFSDATIQDIMYYGGKK